MCSISSIRRICRRKVGSIRIAWVKVGVFSRYEPQRISIKAGLCSPLARRDGTGLENKVSFVMRSHVNIEINYLSA
jgi:hypothetical protein